MAAGSLFSKCPAVTVVPVFGSQPSGGAGTPRAVALAVERMAGVPVRPQTAPPAKLDLDFESTLGGAAYFKFLTDSLEGESGGSGAQNLSKLHAGLGGSAASSSSVFAPQPQRPSSTGWALEGSSSCLPSQMNALALAAASQQTTLQAAQLQAGRPPSERARAPRRLPEPTTTPRLPLAITASARRRARWGRRRSTGCRSARRRASTICNSWRPPHSSLTRGSSCNRWRCTRRVNKVAAWGRHSRPPRDYRTTTEGLGLPSARVGRGTVPQKPPRGRVPGATSRQTH